MKLQHQMVLRQKNIGPEQNKYLSRDQFNMSAWWLWYLDQTSLEGRCTPWVNALESCHHPVCCLLPTRTSPLPLLGILLGGFCDTVNSTGIIFIFMMKYSSKIQTKKQNNLGILLFQGDKLLKTIWIIFGTCFGDEHSLKISAP